MLTTGGVAVVVVVCVLPLVTVVCAVFGTHKLKVLARSLLALLLLGVLSQPASAQYTWKNVRMVAGGFITGIVYHPNVQNLVYARTDIGGLYRSTDGGTNWVPLLDWINWSNWGYSGVLSVALDPQNAGLVYAAVGGYTSQGRPLAGRTTAAVD